MLLAITGEAEDKALEVDEGQEGLVVVVTLAEKNLNKLVITTSHMKSREEN